MVTNVIFQIKIEYTNDSTDFPTGGTKRATDMPEDEEDLSDEDTTTSSNALTSSVETTTDDDDDDSDNDETKYSKGRRKCDTTLTDDSKDYVDDQNATLKPSSLGTTQAVTGLSSTDVKKKSASSLLQFGYLIISSCAMIILLTFVHLYRRVFRGTRQPYINLEQANHSRISGVN
ncbi:hypothetical protein PsorP6_019380 [Peronosclerospora sorghi]|nr:hypothetical protein PsorP6_019380 [Peronosclerospora sorghi]